MPRRANAVASGTAPTAHCGPLDKFTRHRQYNSQISRELTRDTDLIELAKRIGNCASVLGLEIADVDDTHLETRIRAHRPCNARLCPWCEWRRTKAWRARLIGGMDALRAHNPKLIPIFITLTVRNPLLTDLRSTLQEMNAAWNRMRQRAFFPTDLWFRRTEITVGSLPHQPITAHPHFHVLAFVSPSYFSRHYVSQLTWQQEWMTALRADYAPVVDIRRAHVKPSKLLSSEIGSPEQMSASQSAAIEAAKYLSKATHLLELGDALPEFHWQTRGLRLYACSKSLRSFIPDGNIQEEEMNDAAFENIKPEDEVMKATAVWFDDIQQYVFSEVAVAPYGRM